MSDLRTMTAAAIKPVTDLHQQTPRGRLVTKYIKTVVGFLVFVGAFFMPKYLGIPAVASYVVAAFGGFIMSQELVTGFIKIIPAAIAALKGAKVP